MWTRPHYPVNLCLQSHVGPPLGASACLLIPSLFLIVPDGRAGWHMPWSALRGDCPQWARPARQEGRALRAAHVMGSGSGSLVRGLGGHSQRSPGSSSWSRAGGVL